MSDLKEKDIHFLFCRITDITDKMIKEFSKHYNDNVKFELVSKDVFGHHTVCAVTYWDCLGRIHVCLGQFNRNGSISVSVWKGDWRHGVICHYSRASLRCTVFLTQRLVGLCEVDNSWNNHSLLSQNSRPIKSMNLSILLCIL